MVQYIDKSAVVAEIEKLQLCTMDEHMNFYSTEAQGEYNALSKLESFLDTLEVKEVDLEKEMDKEWNKCEPIDVDEAAEEWFNSVKYKSDLSCAPVNAFKAGAEWMMNNLWHSADGGDLLYSLLEQLKKLKA